MALPRPPDYGVPGMKICFIVNDVDPGSGWGRYAGDIVRCARQAGHHVRVVQVPSRGTTLLAALLRCWLASRNCDIVYGLDGWPFGVLAWIVSRAWRTKLIIGGIGTYTIVPLHRRFIGAAVRQAYRAADAVIAISHYTGDCLREVVPQAKVTVITPGIAPERWRVARDADGAPVVISVGALKGRKGYHVALEAFAMAKTRMPALRWAIVGDRLYRSYAERIMKRAAELSVTGAIDWYEHIDDSRLRELYARARLFLLLSENHGGHFEGFGIVFLEAAAAGLPVIGTTGNGIADAVGPENGILVPQGDARAAADAIVAIFSDNARWLAMSAAGRAWAAKHNLGAMCRALEDIYRSIVH